jgi:spoIIIJ-associated protein
MPNDERKVIHQMLSEMKNIRTESEGDGNHRRLRIIFDKNKN